GAPPQRRVHQRGPRAEEGAEDDRAAGAERVERPGRYLRDELGREAVQPVREAGGAGRQAEGEELAVVDLGQRREGLDLVEADGVDGGRSPAAHARTTTLSRIQPSRPRRAR